MDAPESRWSFGPFCLDLHARVLLARDVPVPLGGRAFDVLAGLIRRAGDLAGKAALMDEVWPGIAVEENNLTTQILNLRKALKAHDPGTTYIATVAGRGYRFVAPVTRAAAPMVRHVSEGAYQAAPRDGCEDAPAGGQAGGSGFADSHGGAGNLPVDRSSFIGRAAELAELAGLLGRRSLVTIVGAGGVGKTRCALRAGRAAAGDFTGGVWLVELAGLRDGGLVAEALCRAIGAVVSAGRPATDVATAFLRGRSALVILDNCEHLLDAACALADALLAHCPGVKILATSRQKLGLDGEAVYPMPSLPVPEQAGAATAEAALQADAVRLFAIRAADAVGGYTLTDEDAADVAGICRRLDGVPMAIELAAARMRMLKPAEIAARLEDVFHLLTGGSKAALPRQQTLRATIDWSYVLLAPLEQMALRRLSVFIDGFSLEGATAVAGGDGIEPADVLDLLTALLDKSLLKPDMSGPVTRYRMAETTRAYAREKHQASGEIGRERRLAEYLAQLYGRAERTWAVMPTDAWLAVFCPDTRNLRAAIAWAFRPAAEGGGPEDAALGIELVASAGGIATEMSLQPDIRRWTALAVPHLGDATPPGRAGWLLYWSAQNEPTFGVGEVSPLRRRMIALFRAAGDVVGLSCALRTTGISIARRGDPGGEALAMLTEAVTLLRPLGRNKDLATALAHLGTFHYINGDVAQAVTLNEEALAMRRALGDRTGVAISFLNLAEFAFVGGDAAAALGYAVEAVALARRHTLLEILGLSLCNMANYRQALGDLAGGVAAAREALPLLRAMGKEDHVVLCLENLALAQAMSGDAARAARMLGYTSAYFRRTGQQREPSDALRYEKLTRTLETTLVPERLHDLMAAGAAMTAEDAIMNAEDAASACLMPGTASPGGPFHFEALPENDLTPAPVFRKTEASATATG